MNPFEFALGVIVIVFVYRLLQARMRYRNAEPKDDAAAAEARTRLDSLEERIRVLERIVTDERYDLKREFKDLGA
jgi:hypothetical protein